MSKPFYYLWLYEQHPDRIILEHNDDCHPADAVTHTEMLEDLPNNPDDQLGYAYRIDGGWRITNDEHDAIDDPHVVDLIKKKIQQTEKDDDSQHSFDPS